MDQLEDLDVGMPSDVELSSKPTLLGRVKVHEGLDEGLEFEADEAVPEPELTFCPPEEYGPPEPVEAEVPPIAFLFLMAFVGAAGALLAFHRQVSAVFLTP